MANYNRHEYNTYLSRGKVVSVLGVPLSTHDYDADAFMITVKDADFTGGKCYGDFIRADGKTIVLGGSISGNTATVILNDNCYSIAGRFRLTVKVEASGSRTTYLDVEGYARPSSTDEYAVAGDDSAPIDVILEAAEKAEQVLSAVANKAPAIYEDASGDNVTITDGAAMPVQSLITHVEPVQEGSGDPSPDNVRPISGWDSVTEQRTGKNLLKLTEQTTTKNSIEITVANDRVVMNGTATNTNSTQVTVANLRLLPGVYTVSYTVESGSAEGLADDATYLYIDVNGMVYRVRRNASAIVITVTETANANFRVIVPANGKIFDNFTLLFQLESGDTATDFEPPNMQTLTAELPETLYGFDKNWTTGLVTVMEFVVTYDGTEAWSAGSVANSVRMEKPLNAAAAVVCSHYTVGPTTGANAKDNSVNIGTLINFRDSVNAVDVDTWKAYLAAQAATGTPVTVVCARNTPYTIQLTPQQMETLKGVNNIWSDAGATEVTYAADTKLYIDQKIAAIAAAIV